MEVKLNKNALLESPLPIEENEVMKLLKEAGLKKVYKDIKTNENIAVVDKKPRDKVFHGIRWEVL